MKTSEHINRFVGNPSIVPVQIGESVKEFLKRHAARLVFRQHHELQRALESRGFLVKNVRRMEEHGVWRLSLRSESVTVGSEPGIVRRRVAEVLHELGHDYP